ncbi:PE family protein [Mycobacterium vicinigordonae]|uniref:PE family protein n=1 Tax=Mycobacterium vicinigordonae TaxID=1719132 RepID=UPI001FE7F594|nr:PE-PPE domain-containing protein [Mycobacterium vicinigordonae]
MLNIHLPALTSAAADVAAIGSAVNDAAVSAASATTDVAAAAADEVSEAITTLFNAQAQECQAVLGQIAALHTRFGQALAASGAAYAGTESATLSALAADPAVTFVMAGSGTPTPSWTFVNDMVSRYLKFPAGDLMPLTLPAGEYPDSGIKDLTQAVSLSRGVTILNNAVQQQLAAGKTVNVLGYSQSANIASLLMQQLDPSGTPSSLPINFVLLGNSMNPNGGWDARFPGLSLPTLGFSTLGAAPSNSFNTVSYTLEYDGWADFPRYPINVVSDLNALVGMVTVHGTYDSVTAAQLASAVVLPTVGDTMTTYYMIPSQNLPLLEPLRYLPVVGDPLADLIQPVLRPLVNWGYGDPSYGWSTGPANVPTPFGFLPPLSDTLALGPAMLHGIPAGITAAVNDIQGMGLPTLGSLESLVSAPGTLALPTFPASIPDLLSGLQAANTQIVSGATTAVSTAYATLLPTADITMAALVSLPSYDVNLFLGGVSQIVSGQPLAGLLSAFGDPVAANFGLLPFLGGLELAVLAEAADSIVTGTPYPSP